MSYQNAVFLIGIIIIVSGCKKDEKKSGGDDINDPGLDLPSQVDEPPGGAGGDETDSAEPEGYCDYECVGISDCATLGGTHIKTGGCDWDRSEVCCFLPGPDTGLERDTDPDAEHLVVDRISLFQGVEVTLMRNGEEIAERNAPVVANRDALMRVHFYRPSGWASRVVQAFLEIESSTYSGALTDEMTVSQNSSDATLASSFNFDIPAAYLSGDVTYRVYLMDGDVMETSWPEDGTAEMGEESAGDNLEIVLVPIEYNADGTGRVPDTSADQVELYREYFERFYPLPEGGVDISVGTPMPTNTEVLANGTGWEELVVEVMYHRYYQYAEPHQYYFGLFEPDSSLRGYCGLFGCTLGIGFVPPEPGYYNGAMSVAIGLGYTGEDSAATMVHEVGHNHGREHAPCDIPGETDPNYPYTGGGIGVWGYDVASGDLKDPAVYTDFMGYCYDAVWTSDYTYDGIFDWMVATNRLKRAPTGPKETWQTLTINLRGEIAAGQSIAASDPGTGKKRKVALYDLDENLIDATIGYFVPLTHAPAGMVLYQSDLAESAQFVSVDGGDLFPM